jgi:hypothetical protein
MNEWAEERKMGRSQRGGKERKQGREEWRERRKGGEEEVCYTEGSRVGRVYSARKAGRAFQVTRTAWAKLPWCTIHAGRDQRPWESSYTGLTEPQTWEVGEEG